MFTIRYNRLEKIFVCDKKLSFIEFACQVGDEWEVKSKR